MPGPRLFEAVGAALDAAATADVHLERLGSFPSSDAALAAGRRVGEEDTWVVPDDARGWDLLLATPLPAYAIAGAAAEAAS